MITQRSLWTKSNNSNRWGIALIAPLGVQLAARHPRRFRPVPGLGRRPSALDGDVGRQNLRGGAQEIPGN